MRVLVARVAGVVGAAALVVANAIALLFADLGPNDRLTAGVLVVLAAVGLVLLARGVPGAAERLRGVEVLRLDDDGVHLHQGMLGLGPSTKRRGVERAWTMTLPWSRVTAVSITDLEGLADELRFAAPTRAVRFVVHDDRDTPRPSGPPSQALRSKATQLGLTPTQARGVALLRTERTTPIAPWLARHRPGLAVEETSHAAWLPTPLEDDVAHHRRIAVVGGHARLATYLLPLIAERFEGPPVAIVRNEAHRSAVTALGADVRMLDLQQQGIVAIARALRGCTDVVYLAGSDDPASRRDLGLLQVARVVEAMGRTDLRRIVVVTRPVVAGEPDLAGLLGATTAAWTVLRVAALSDEPATGEVDAGAAVVPGTVTRADLAELVAAALGDPDAIGLAWNVRQDPTSTVEE